MDDRLRQRFGNWITVSLSGISAREVITRCKTNLRNVDWVLVAGVIFLCLVGSTVVYSATFYESHVEYGNRFMVVSRHLSWVCLGIVSLTLASLVPISWWEKMAVPIMGVVLFLLLLVLLIGEKRFGAQRTFFDGAVRPAELAKPATVIYLAAWLVSRGDQIRDVTYGLVPFAVLIGVIAGLIVAQPDMGTAVLISTVALAMFFIAGGDIIQLAIGGGVSIATFLFLIIKFPHASERITDWITTWQSQELVNYHVRMAISAMVSGGWLGRGVGKGQFKLGWLPVPRTHSVLAVVAEEFGWVGCLAVVLAFTAVVWRGLRVARRSDSGFATLLAFGVSALLGVQILFNLAALTGAIPFVGMDLPLFSASASVTMAFLTSFGILIRVSTKATSEKIHLRSSSGDDVLVADSSTWAPIDMSWVLLISVILLGGSVLHGGVVGLTTLPTPPDSFPIVASRVFENFALVSRITAILLGLGFLMSVLEFRRFQDGVRAALHWEEVIEEKLQAKGQVRARVFGPFGSICLERYLEEYKELDLVLENSRRLRYADRQLKRDCDRLWQKISKTSRKQVRLRQDVASELLRILGTALRCPRSSNSVELIGAFFAGSLDVSILFTGLRMPKELIVLIPRDSIMTEKDWIQVPRVVRSVSSGSDGIAVLIAWSRGHMRSEMAEHLRQVYAFDLVPLTEDNMRKLVTSRDPDRLFREAVLQNISLVTISPFVTTGSTPPEVFFGREAELREITEHAPSSSYAIVGGRRVGKTSLLSRLHNVRLPGVGLYALYHDCSTTPNYDSFLAAPARSWQPEPPINVPSTLGELMKYRSNGQPYILLLDEADKLVNADRENGWRLFSALRACATSGGIRLVFSGERTLRDATQDPSSPLFNFADEILLGPLDFGAVEELVIRPMEQLGITLYNEEAIVELIWRLTAGHPNVVQRLCSKLVKRVNEQGSRGLGLADVRAVVEDPGFQETDFLQTYWEAALPLEKIITLVLAEANRDYHLEEVHQLLVVETGIHPSVTQTKGALDRLVDLRSILKRSPDGYSFAVKAFPQVLRNTTTVEDLLLVLIEEFEDEEATV